jgi:hypothetical protein
MTTTNGTARTPFIRDGDSVFRTYFINKPQVVLTAPKPEAGQDLFAVTKLE